jgi:hypothetical protein
VNSPTLGQVLRQAIVARSSGTLNLSPHQWKTVRALAACRTGALGGQLFRCTTCEREHFVAHSCRNRHCPQCQGALAAEWLTQQEAALLPVSYFHLVFTLPHVLNGLIRQNRCVLFKLLFDAASSTLLEFGEGELHAQIGITAVLHTWSQTLLDHYHLHCIVTGGGVALDGTKWVSSQTHYLFPVKAMSRMFRGKFLDGLARRFAAGELKFHGQLIPLAQPAFFSALTRQAASTPWVVYAKRPFAGPKDVLAYLSRYTHRVAISNRRLISADAQSVSFDYKDYAQGAEHKIMKLDSVEFVRRFCLHILPERFVKIRHYGLLGNRQREKRLEQVRQLLGASVPAVPDDAPTVKEIDAQRPLACPFCQKTTLVLLGQIGPPRRTHVPVLDSS